LPQPSPGGGAAEDDFGLARSTRGDPQNYCSRRETRKGKVLADSSSSSS
jgi:hypothetical protein